MKLTLSLPVKPYNLNQGFGINGEYYRANGINVLGHNGLDLKAYHGQPVYASHDGFAYAQVDNKSGHGVVIITDKQYDYKDTTSLYKTIYWHLANPTATYPHLVPLEGREVKRGEQIGWADNTGLSGGDHLHYGLKPVKGGVPPTSGDAPDVVGNYVNQEPDNGYMGAIDPLLYLEGLQFFTRDLSFGSMGEDVRRLQKFLNSRLYTVTDPGKETTFYGLKTRDAVIRLQKAVGITPASGYFGPKTRAFINNL